MVVNDHPNYDVDSNQRVDNEDEMMNILTEMEWKK